MYSLTQLEKQQVGLRLPRYLIEQLDELASSHSLNRSDLIFEAVRSYIERQKAEVFYQEFDESLQELRALRKGQKVADCSLDDLINDLEN